MIFKSLLYLIQVSMPHIIFQSFRTLYVLSCFSHVHFFTPLTVAHLAPLPVSILQAIVLKWIAMPSSRVLPNPGIEPTSLKSLHWQVGSLPLVPHGKPQDTLSTQFFSLPSAAWGHTFSQNDHLSVVRDLQLQRPRA